jgi:hypothetical protein
MSETTNTPAVDSALERAHHPFSPSKLQNLEQCPLYESNNSINERAIAGTLAHGVTETGEDHASLGDDDAAAASFCMDWVHREKLLMEEARDRAITEQAHAEFGPDYEPEEDEFNAVWSGKRESMPPVVELMEGYLPVDDCKHDCLGKVVDSTTAGYFDRALIDHTGEYCLAVDFKFGRWAVETCATSLQAISYVLGLFRAYPKLQRIKFVFIQPALDVVDGHTFYRSEIPDLYRRVQVVVLRAIEARNSKNWDTARPAIPVCNFCGAIGRCPKVAAIACTISKKFSPLNVPNNVTPTFLDSPENTAEALNVAAVMGVWAAAFRAVTTDRVIRRDAPIPPGFTLASRANREVVNEALARKVALQFVTEEEFNSITSFPGFGDLEEIVSEKAPRGLKSSTVTALKDALKDSGAVVSGQPYAFLRASPTRKDKTEGSGE